MKIPFLSYILIKVNDERGIFMDWTKEQKQAIVEKDSNILVAAAAR